MTTMNTGLAFVPSLDAIVEIPVHQHLRARRRRDEVLASARKGQPKPHRERRECRSAILALTGEYGDRDPIAPGGVRVTTPLVLNCRRRFLAGSVTPAGLYKLTTEAVAAYQAATGHTLPWNLSWHCAGVSRYQGQEPDTGQLERVARITGWLPAAASGPFPTLRKLIAKCASSRGVSSPYTTLNVWDLASHTRSPGAAEALLRKVRRRANSLLSAYGVSVSWAGLAAALESGDRRVGKAARKAARHTLAGLLERRFGLGMAIATGSGLYRMGGTHYSDPPTSREELVDPLMMARGLKWALGADPRVQKWAGDRIRTGEFADLRSALAAATRLVVDTTDEVEVLTDPTLAESVGGCRVTPGYRKATVSGPRGGAWVETHPCHVVRGPSGRTYHGSGNYLPHGPQGLVREAVAAWRRQDELAATNAELVGNDRYSVIIRVEHSYQAGNCQPATQAWMERHGLAGRRIVPARELLRLVDTDSRVRGALVAAALEAKAQASA